MADVPDAPLALTMTVRSSASRTEVTPLAFHTTPTRTTGCTRPIQVNFSGWYLAAGSRLLFSTTVGCAVPMTSPSFGATL